MTSGRGRSAALLAALALACTACVSTVAIDAQGDRAPTPAPAVEPTTAPVPTPTLGPASQTIAAIAAPTATPEPWYGADLVGAPWGDAVQGVLTFRGSPNRTWYGRGPVPSSPRVQWTYPQTPMCSLSSDLEGEREWCGTGWTGQPAVWERSGRLWVAFGAYDRAVHVLDALTGTPIVAPFVTGDLIKGSLTVDPDGHPLIYVGSRDNRLRALSFDRGELRELWALDAQAIEPRVWNDDWDGAPIVIDDYLFVGGENSNFHVARLNRSYDSDGFVTMAPELLAVIPGWDSELRQAVGDNVSIESSVTIVDDVVYAANSGGLISGWDVSGVRDGDAPTRVFRFWMGDDTDASLVVDDEGFLYAGAEYERGNGRSQVIGQIAKLDPRRPDDPLVWSVSAQRGIGTGIWATPAVHGDVVIVPTADGRVLGLDRYSGAAVWTLRLPGPLWSSPVIVDDVLVQGDCGGFVHGFDLATGSGEPAKLWSVPVGGCIESTPVVWDGRIWVGTRGGHFHMLE